MFSRVFSIGFGKYQDEMLKFLLLFKENGYIHKYASRLYIGILIKTTKKDKKEREKKTLPAREKQDPTVRYVHTYSDPFHWNGNYTDPFHWHEITPAGFIRQGIRTKFIWNIHQISAVFQQT